MGAACLFLAIKVCDEKTRKISQLIIVCAQKAAKNDNLKLDESSKEFCKWRDNILFYEQIILETICYDMEVELPLDSLVGIYSKTQADCKERGW